MIGADRIHTIIDYIGSNNILSTNFDVRPVRPGQGFVMNFAILAHLAGSETFLQTALRVSMQRFRAIESKTSDAHLHQMVLYCMLPCDACKRED